MKTGHVFTSFGEFAYEDSGGSGTAILMLHGGASNLRAWDGVIPILRASYRCIALDLPGHGRTILNPLPFDDLSGALIQICNELNVLNPILIGHSFGGLAVAATAVRYPHLALGVMAIDPYLNNKEIRQRYKTVDDATAEIRSMIWPWKDTYDLDTEVSRHAELSYSPRENESDLKAMIRRGYRLQIDGRYERFPRREDEIRGVEANWSIDVGMTFSAIECPLSISVSRDPVWRLEKRSENLREIEQHVKVFETVEFQCGHDIPGHQPEELGRYIVSWINRI